MLHHRLRAFAERHHLWQSDTRVIAALSGGADSVAMLLLLRDLHRAGELVLDAAAHLHHGIRGADADADQTFCRTLCARLDVPLLVSRVEVPSLAKRDRVSLEVAARRARHDFLAEVRRTRGADVVATAHTEDDQAETVLLRIVRGAGGRGLGGIPPKRDHLIRPVLGIARHELRAELGARGETWREDATNADVANPRNRVRAELLPYLATHFNPSVTRALARLADVARADEAWLEERALDACGTAVRPLHGEVSLNISALGALPTALARRAARQALETANPARSYGVEAVDLVLAVAAGRPRAAEISGLRVERFGDSEVLVKRAPRSQRRRRGVRS